MTAAQDAPNGPPDLLLEMVRQGLEEDPEFEATALVGLVNVSSHLLVLLEKETGKPASEWLAHIGTRYMGE